jgi:hypothetical protein
VAGANSNTFQHRIIVSVMSELKSVHVAELDFGTTAWVSDIQTEYTLADDASLVPNDNTVLLPVPQAIVGKLSARWVSPEAETGFVPTSLTLTAGAGLVGGGDLAANRTFAVGANPDGSIVVNAHDVQVGVITAAQHGNLAGGALHAAASEGTSGFMSAADKVNLDALVSGAGPYALTTTTMTAGAGMTGGGSLAANRTFNVAANADGSIVVNADDIQVGVISGAQHGNLTGGILHAAASEGTSGFMSAADKVNLDALVAAEPYASGATTITAGAGLTGGGSLAANRTLAVGANADGSITVNADDIQVGILATDAQHGARGGGTQHAVATGASAGFMSAADKTSLSGATPAATPSTLSSRDTNATSAFGNVLILAGAGLGSGQGVISLANATTVPTVNPTAGGIEYASGGALLYLGPSGTLTTLAPA